MKKKQAFLIFGLGGFMAILIGVFGYISWQADRANHPVGQAAIEEKFKVKRAGVENSYDTCKSYGLIMKEDFSHQSFFLDPKVYEQLPLDGKKDMGFVLFLEASFALEKCPDQVFFNDGYTGKLLAIYDLKNGFSIK